MRGKVEGEGEGEGEVRGKVETLIRRGGGLQAQAMGCRPRRWVAGLACGVRHLQE